MPPEIIKYLECEYASAQRILHIENYNLYFALRVHTGDIYDFPIPISYFDMAGVVPSSLYGEELRKWIQIAVDNNTLLGPGRYQY